MARDMHGLNRTQIKHHVLCHGANLGRALQHEVVCTIVRKLDSRIVWTKLSVLGLPA
jgi:hypothetical protein